MQDSALFWVWFKQGSLYRVKCNVFYYFPQSFMSRTFSQSMSLKQYLDFSWIVHFVLFIAGWYISSSVSYLLRWGSLCDSLWYCTCSRICICVQSMTFTTERCVWLLEIYALRERVRIQFRFNPAISLCPSKARTKISIDLCHLYFICLGIWVCERSC